MSFFSREQFTDSGLYSLLIGIFFFFMGLDWLSEYREDGRVNSSRFDFMPANSGMAEFICYLIIFTGVVFFVFGFNRVIKYVFADKT